MGPPDKAGMVGRTLFFFFFLLFKKKFFFFTLEYCIGFAIHQNASTTGDQSFGLCGRGSGGMIW